jgi:hypothetical protein
VQKRDQNCVPASYFVYTYNNKKYVLNVPEDSMETIAGLAEKEAYDQLGQYHDKYKSKADEKFPPSRADIEWALTMGQLLLLRGWISTPRPAPPSTLKRREVRRTLRFLIKGSIF